MFNKYLSVGSSLYLLRLLVRVQASTLPMSHDCQGAKTQSDLNNFKIIS